MKRQFLVFADKMFARSEGFIAQSYKSLDQLQPIFIGSELRELPPSWTRAIPLNPLHGPVGETGFKQLGLVSEKLKERLAEEKPLLIHAHFGKSSAYALPLARAMGLPLAITYHGGDATKKANTRSSAFRVYNRRRAQLWQEAALILPVSEFIKGELQAAGCPPEKMAVNYNGADPSRFKPGHKSRLTGNKVCRVCGSHLGVWASGPKAQSLRVCAGWRQRRRCEPGCVPGLQVCTPAARKPPGSKTQC